MSERLFVTVDMEYDLGVTGADTAPTLWALREMYNNNVRTPALIDGVTVSDGDTAGILLDRWVAACERAWIAQAEALGHEGAVYSPAETYQQERTQDNLRRYEADGLPIDEAHEIAHEEVQAAHQQVWDTVWLPHLADLQEEK